MKRMLFCAALASAAFLGIGGCAHVDSDFKDPLGSTAQLPASPSAGYAPSTLPRQEELIPDESGPEKGSHGKGSSEKGDPTSMHTKLNFAGRTLDLAECIRIGLEFNPETQSTWQALRSAAARVGEQQSAYFPEIDLTTGAIREKQVSFQSLQSKQQSNADNLFTTAFALNYLLFDGGQRFARVGGARADVGSVGFQHNAALQSVALKIEQSYYALLAARWSLQVAEETVHNAGYHVRLAQARFDTGLVPRSDVLKAETEKADGDLALVSARSTIRIGEGALASAMGLKVSTPVEIADVPEGMHALEAQDMDRLLDEAMEHRPELLAAVSKVKSKQSALDDARSQYWPKISANAGYGWIDDSFFPNQDQWSIGLSLSFPIFTGFKRGYQVEGASRDTEQARAEYVSRLRGIELEVWTAYSKLTEAAEAIQAARTFVASAEESARLADGEYKAGTGNIIALIDAQTALTSARNRLVQARFAWYNTRAQFEKSVGRKISAGN